MHGPEQYTAVEQTVQTFSVEHPDLLNKISKSCCFWSWISVFFLLRYLAPK